jgi:uncharacterized protein YhdP
VAWLVAVGTVLIAVLSWRLSDAPVSLAWLTPAIERALTPADGDFRVEIDRTELRLGDDQLIELVGYEVMGLAPDGSTLFALPEIELNLSLSALALHGVVAPERIHASAPLLGLVRREDGSIGLRASADHQAAPQVTPEMLIGLFMSADPDQPLSHLDRLEISGGALVIQDLTTGQTLLARDAELGLTRQPGGVNAAVSFELEQPHGLAGIAVTGRYERGSEWIGFIAELRELAIPPLASFAPELSLDGIDLVLNGRLAGAVSMDGSLSAITFDLSGENGRIERPDLLSQPLPVDRLKVEGQAQPDLGEVVVDGFSLTSLGARLEGSGRLVRGNDGTGLSAELRAANVRAEDLDLFWPPELGEQARKWVLENISSGTVPSAEARLEFAPGELSQRPVPESSVQGRFEFDDAAVRYFETMPPLTGGDGSATFTGRRMDFVVTDGAVDQLSVREGSVVITGMGIKGRDTTQLEVRGKIDGPISQALALLERPPLRFASKLGIDPASTSGQARADLRIGMPLHRDLEPSELRVGAAAVLIDAAAAGLRDRFDLSEGQFELAVDNESLELSGNGAIEGVPLAIAWRESFDDRAEVQRRFEFEGEVPVAALQRFQLEPPIPLDGAFELQATAVESAGVMDINLVLGLRPLAVDLPWLDWRKAAGEDGRLVASLTLPDQGPVRIDPFEAMGPGLAAAGRVELAREPWQLESLRLDHARLGDSAGALSILQDEDGRYQITMEAQSLDLGRLLAMRQQQSGGEQTTLPPLSASLVAERVLMNGRALTDASAELTRDETGWQAARLGAVLPDGGTLEARLAPEDGRQRLTIASSNAGNLLQALDQTHRIQGGELSLNAVITRREPTIDAEGTFKIDDFTLVDAPVLARLLTLASLTGIGNLLGGEGIFFDRLDLPFQLRDGSLIFDRGRMSGSQLGLTMSGKVGLETRELDLEGTIVPVYTVNRILGKIPLVGPFLAGEEGEGAFAATYWVQGELSDPQITVNPLAVLAPGFLRDLFSGIMEGSLEPPEPPQDRN